ncbi:MAG: hypothetical protein V1904_01110 [Bacteroidota bacterium]
MLSGILVLFFACNGTLKKTVILDMDFSDHEYTNWKITENDIDSADKILYDYLKIASPALFSDQNKYFRQCWGLKNMNKQEIVCYNCFCREMPDWKKNLIVSSGGGDCFWSAKVNLDTKECYDFSVNGPK